MAIDLGIINLASCVTNKGFSEIYSGKQALAIQHYFNSRKARVQSKLNEQFPKRHKSNTFNNLNRKQIRQINQIIHTISKKVIDRAKELNIKTIIIGDLKDITKETNYGRRNNQKLHSWSFSKLTQQIEYKAILSGIRFVRVNEENTSKTCSRCGTIRKSNRIHRGLYKCKTCGNVINADINGACNILKKYLQIQEDRSIGEVVSPLVSRIENVIPR
jgi:putative transposase